MMTTTITPTPSKNDTDGVNAAIQGKTQSLYAGMVQLLSVEQVTKSMNANAKAAPLSKIYPTNPYKYNFQNGKDVNVNISIDVSTTWYKSADHNLFNGMTGKLPANNKYCGQFQPDFTTHGGELFFTKEFIQNFVEYNVVTFGGWQNVVVDKRSVRSTLLQWRLLDLDFVVDGLWNDLWMVGENEIYFTCSAKENVAAKLIPTSNKLHQTLKWRCQGFVKLNDTTTQKVIGTLIYYKNIEFLPRVDHIVDLSVYDHALKPYVNVLKFIDCEFVEVKSLDGKGVYKVNEKNLKLAQQLMESVFNDFRVYPMGHRFWLGGKSTMLSVDDDGAGVWVF